MATSDIQCFTCSAEFSKVEELRDHIWYFQTEVATLLEKLQQLLAHRLPIDTEIRNIEPRISPERQDAIECTSKPPGQVEENPLQPLPKSTHYTGEVQEESIQRCPFPGCRKTYTRNQDLVRHCIEHLQMKEFCHFCARTLPAHLYIKHSCIKKGVNERAYIKKRAKTLRDLAKRKFMSLDQEPLAASGMKDLRTTEPLARQTVLESLPLVQDQNNRISNNPIATSMFLQGSIRPQPETAQTSLNHRGIAYPRSYGHSSGADHLFSPLNSSGQEQLQFPIPLWSLEDTMQPFYPSNSSSLHTASELSTLPENFGAH